MGFRSLSRHSFSRYFVSRRGSTRRRRVDFCRAPNVQSSPQPQILECFALDGWLCALDGCTSEQFIIRNPHPFIHLIHFMPTGSRPSSPNGGSLECWPGNCIPTPPHHHAYFVLEVGLCNKYDRLDEGGGKYDSTEKLLQQR